MVTSASLAALVGCVDLFHSTDFGTCDGGPGCGEDALSPVDAGHPRDARKPRADAGSSDARARQRDGAADATLQRDAGHDAARDVASDALRDVARHDASRSSQDAARDAPPDSGRDAPHADAPRDARHDSHHDAGRDAPVDAPADVSIDAAGDTGEDAPDVHDSAVDHGVDAPPPVDSGTDFCKWDADMAQTSAARACLWLGACAGNEGVNEFGACYATALLAYDCALNPNQRVHGAVHAFWDGLWHVSTCDDVLGAVFPGGVPTCTANPTGCGDGLSDGGAYANVVVGCADGGGLVTAQNCAMVGYTCSQGECTNGGPPCTAPTAASCAGNVFHACQAVEGDASVQPVILDVGKDCTNFGAGACVLVGDGGGGCLPEDASTPCAPSIAARCATGDPTSVTGCAAGYLETLHCPGFGAENTCSIMGNWFASSSQLPQGCYDTYDNGLSMAVDSCSAIAAFSDYAGPAGNLEVRCADAGLGACTTTAASGYRPICMPPP